MMRTSVFRQIQRQSGFSLIELMIVVAIIGILAAIAIPNYNEHVTKAKLAEAISALSDMRVKMERHFQDNRTYRYTGADQVNNCAPAGAQALAPLPANTQNFTFACSNVADNTYTITASGIGSMTGFSLSINQDNVRRTVSTGDGWVKPNPDTCWVRSKGGGC